MTIIKAHFDGKAFIPDEPVNLPVDQPAIVQYDTAATAKSAKKYMSARDLLDSGLFGIWKDRSDITDSLEFARDLRKRSETRHHEIDDPS